MKTQEKAVNDYIKEKHNQDECSGFIDGYKQCQNDMGKSIEDMWVKYREVTNNEDAWSFKQWIINSLNNKDN